MSEYMLSKDYFVQVIRDLIVLAEDRKEYFTDLDSAIGDGDHGINLSIGFREVNKNIEDWKGLSVRDFYNKVGTALLDKVGGSSGPLYGSFFMKFGLPIKTKGPDEGATFEEFIAMMEKGVEISKSVVIPQLERKLCLTHLFQQLRHSAKNTKAEHQPKKLWRKLLKLVRQV